MEIAMVITILTAIVLVIGLIFNIYKVSRFMTLLELKPSKEEVLKMIEKKFDNHCPYSDRIDKTEERLDAFDDYKTGHQEWGQKENVKNQMLLQELVINTKNICDHLQMKYFKKNGD